MAERIIELKWRCADCGRVNLGRHKECPDGCGSPREKGEMLGMDGLGADDYDSAGYNRAESVTDASLVDLANAGADWFCSHCTAGNRGDGDRCSKCGGPRYGTAEEDHPEVPGDHRRVEGADARLEREMGATPDPEPRRAPPPPRRPTRPADDFEDYHNPPPSTGVAKLLLLGGGALAVLGLLVWFLVWAFTTHESRGAVTAMTWSRTAYYEHWTQVERSLWRHQTDERAETPPVRGAGERAGYSLVPGTCRNKKFDTEKYVDHYRTVDDPVYKTTSCDTKRVKDGETCRPTDNGFAKCTDKYKTVKVNPSCQDGKRVLVRTDHHQEPVYAYRDIMKDECTYRTQSWVVSGTYPSSGRGTDLTWAGPPLTDLDRAQYTADYKVSVAYKDDGKALEHDIVFHASRVSKSSAEATAVAYLTWQVGDPVHLEVNNLGGVSSATHPQAKP